MKIRLINPINPIIPLDKPKQEVKRWRFIGLVPREAMSLDKFWKLINSRFKKRQTN